MYLQWYNIGHKKAEMIFLLLPVVALVIIMPAIIKRKQHLERLTRYSI